MTLKISVTNPGFFFFWMQGRATVELARWSGDAAAVRGNRGLLGRVCNK